MSVSEADLTSILVHCRELLSAARQLAAIKQKRNRQIEVATRVWEGPHSKTFDERITDEGVDLEKRVAGLRIEAERWASIWARTVNEINSKRRDAAVEVERSARGRGEAIFDIVVGDDSDQMVRSYQPVAIPTADSFYAATGGLETYG